MEIQRRQRTRYGTEQVLDYILEPGSDSELSELGDSEDDEYTVVTNIAAVTNDDPDAAAVDEYGDSE